MSQDPKERLQDANSDVRLEWGIQNGDLKFVEQTLQEGGLAVKPHLIFDAIKHVLNNEDIKNGEYTKEKAQERSDILSSVLRHKSFNPNIQKSKQCSLAERLVNDIISWRDFPDERKILSQTLKETLLHPRYQHNLSTPQRIDKSSFIYIYSDLLPKKQANSPPSIDMVEFLPRILAQAVHYKDITLSQSEIESLQEKGISVPSDFPPLPIVQHAKPYLNPRENTKIDKTFCSQAISLRAGNEKDYYKTFRDSLANGASPNSRTDTQPIVSVLIEELYDCGHNEIGRTKAKTLTQSIQALVYHPDFNMYFTDSTGNTPLALVEKLVQNNPVAQGLQKLGQRDVVTVLKNRQELNEWLACPHEERDPSVLSKLLDKGLDPNINVPIKAKNGKTINRQPLLSLALIQLKTAAINNQKSKINDWHNLAKKLIDDPQIDVNQTCDDTITPIAKTAKIINSTKDGYTRNLFERLLRKMRTLTQPPYPKQSPAPTITMPASPEAP